VKLASNALSFVSSFVKHAVDEGLHELLPLPKICRERL
jgi:hypothetical protein